MFFFFALSAWGTDFCFISRGSPYATVLFTLSWLHSRLYRVPSSDVCDDFENKPFWFLNTALYFCICRSSKMPMDNLFNISVFECVLQFERFSAFDWFERPACFFFHEEESKGWKASYGCYPSFANDDPSWTAKRQLITKLLPAYHDIRTSGLFLKRPAALSWNQKPAFQDKESGSSITWQ